MLFPPSARARPPSFPPNATPVVQPQPPTMNTSPPLPSGPASVLVKGSVVSVKAPAVVQEPITTMKRPVPHVKPRPRSILKSPRTNLATQKKSVRFTASTANPPSLAPGTHKPSGKYRHSRARHPAQTHAYPRNNAAWQQPPAQTSIAIPPCSPARKYIYRPPPPASFFGPNRALQTRTQSHRLPQARQQQQAHVPRTSILTPSNPRGHIRSRSPTSPAGASPARNQFPQTRVQRYHRSAVGIQSRRATAPPRKPSTPEATWW